MMMTMHKYKRLNTFAFFRNYFALSNSSEIWLEASNLFVNVYCFDFTCHSHWLYLLLTLFRLLQLPSLNEIHRKNGYHIWMAVIKNAWTVVSINLYKAHT